MKLKIACMNVENLFARAKVLNLANEIEIDKYLAQIATLQKLIQKEKYTEADKKAIVKTYLALTDFISIQEDRGKLFKKHHYKITGVVASGRDDWDGQVVFKAESFSEMTRENTAKVIRAIRPDIMGVIEAEDLPTLRRFKTNLLSGIKLPHTMLIDGTDPRGIDVGIYSRFPITNIITHIYDKVGASPIFSRDCPEYTIDVEGTPVHVLVNHLKSKGYGDTKSNDAKRKKQASYIATTILKKYNLAKDYVVIVGDLNDTPRSKPLEPLLSTKNLFDVLELQFKDAMQERWTYHYKSFEQIDYILVSKPFRNAFVEAGVERRGIFQLSKLTKDNEKEFNTVTSWRNAASDHGAVWATFEI